jgi:hypothetical protein
MPLLFDILRNRQMSADGTDVTPRSRFAWHVQLTYPMPDVFTLLKGPAGTYCVP